MITPDQWPKIFEIEIRQELVLLERRQRAFEREQAKAAKEERQRRDTTCADCGGKKSKSAGLRCLKCYRKWRSLNPACRSTYEPEWLTRATRGVFATPVKRNYAERERELRERHREYVFPVLKGFEEEPEEVVAALDVMLTSIFVTRASPAVVKITSRDPALVSRVVENLRGRVLMPHGYVRAWWLDEAEEAPEVGMVMDALVGLGEVQWCRWDPERGAVYRK